MGQLPEKKGRFQHLGTEDFGEQLPDEAADCGGILPGQKELPQIKPNQARVRIPASNFLLFVECFMLFSTF